jgi:hypothetical protein
MIAFATSQVVSTPRRFLRDGRKRGESLSQEVSIRSLAHLSWRDKASAVKLLSAKDRYGPRWRQRRGLPRVVAGFQASISGRFGVSTEGGFDQVDWKGRSQGRE